MTAGRDARPRVVYVAPEAPWPTISGGKFRIEALHRLLGNVADVKLVVVGDRPAREVRLRIRAGGGAVFPSRRETPARRLGRMLRAWALGRSIPAGRYDSARRRQKLRALLARERADVIILGDAYLAAAFLPLAREHARAVVVDTHDAASLVASRIAAASANPFGRLAYRVLARNTFAMEARWFPQADEVWTLSEEDASFYRERHGFSNVAVVPTPVALPDSGTRGVAGRDAVFVGSYSYWPNEDAALRLIAMAPALRQAGAVDRVLLVGSAPTARMQAAAARVEGVSITGRVPEVAPFLDRAALVVAPLAAGSGVKVKLLEAMARARPVLTTPVGAEGLAIEPSVHAEVVPLERFAEAAVALMRDEPRRAALAAAGRALVERRHAPAMVQEHIRLRLERLVTRTARTAP